MAKVRELTEGHMSGKDDAPKHFRELVSYLLHQSVAHPDAVVMLVRMRDASSATRSVVAGAQGRPLRLLNGKYLRVSILTDLVPTDEGRGLKVLESSFHSLFR